VKVKKWAKKARSVEVRLEGPGGADLRGVHTIEIKDAKRKTLRTRKLEYRQGGQALSTIMTDTQARLAKNSLIVIDGSYQLVKDGQCLQGVVSTAGTSRRSSP
jgi:hypothetical protein